MWPQNNKNPPSKPTTTTTKNHSSDVLNQANTRGSQSPIKTSLNLEVSMIQCSQNEKNKYIKSTVTEYWKRQDQKRNLFTEDIPDDLHCISSNEIFSEENEMEDLVQNSTK